MRLLINYFKKRTNKLVGNQDQPSNQLSFQKPSEGIVLGETPTDNSTDNSLGSQNSFLQKMENISYDLEMIDLSLRKY